LGRNPTPASELEQTAAVAVADVARCTAQGPRE